MDAAEWCERLKAAVSAYSQSRRRTPVVQVVLDDRESFFIANAEAGPGDDFVSMSAYPAIRPGQAILDAMIEDAEGERRTPRVVVVHFGRVHRIELLADAPGAGIPVFGFAGTVSPTRPQTPDAAR